MWRVEKQPPALGSRGQTVRVYERDRLQLELDGTTRGFGRHVLVQQVGSRVFVVFSQPDDGGGRLLVYSRLKPHESFGLRYPRVRPAEDCGDAEEAPVSMGFGQGLVGVRDQPEFILVLDSHQRGVESVLFALHLPSNTLTELYRHRQHFESLTEIRETTDPSKYHLGGYNRTSFCAVTRTVNVGTLPIPAAYQGDKRH